MTAELYIWIPNWFGPDGFQHYRDRDPIFIKNYTRLLSKDEYVELSMRTRGVLHGVWMEYARSNRRLRGDTLTLTRRLGQKVIKSDLEALNHAGLIELIASDLLAERLQDASARASRARAPAQSREGEEEKQRQEDQEQRQERIGRSVASYAEPGLDIDPLGNGLAPDLVPVPHADRPNGADDDIPF